MPTQRWTLDTARFGDEPALIARETLCPIAVHPNHLRALQALMAQYPEVDCIIADDGLRMDWQDWCTQHREKKVAALAGIGQPERFFAMLRTHGQTLFHTRALADHATLNAANLRGLDDAQAIFITEKDAIKLAHPMDPRLWAVQVSELCPDVCMVDDDIAHPILSFEWVMVISARLMSTLNRNVHFEGFY